MGLLMCARVAAVGGAPEPGVGDTILVGEDHFDGADIATQLSGYATAGTWARQAPGRGGTGACIRANYSSGNDDILIEKGFAETTDCYFRFYFRIQNGWLPQRHDAPDNWTGSGMKWFMPWRDGTAQHPRYTMGTGELTTTHWQFSSHDNSSVNQPNPTAYNQGHATPRFDTVNDGNWHKYTLRVKTTAPAGEQIWVDDVLVLDDMGLYDHDAMGIQLIQFPGLIVDGLPVGGAYDGWLDIDDLVVWHK
jgi:hypothetical protein